MIKGLDVFRRHFEHYTDKLSRFMGINNKNKVAGLSK